MTNFTRLGSVSAYLARSDVPTRFAYLADGARRLQMSLYAIVGKRPVDDKDARAKAAALGCLERLSACLLYIERLAVEAAKIQERCPRQTGQMVGIRAPEVLIDFESLLFHARSALDVTTYFVCSHFYSQRCFRFSRLANVLADVATTDARAHSLQEIVSTVLGSLGGLLVDSDGRRSLRSELVHRSNIGELATVAFTLHCVETDKRLALDTVVADHALLATAGEVTAYVAFVVLNTLSIYVAGGTRPRMPNLPLNWSYPFIDYTRYETDEAEESRVFTVWRPLPSGLTLTKVRLRNEVFEHTY